jgi:hypothetical protein
MCWCRKVLSVFTQPEQKNNTPVLTLWKKPRKKVARLMVKSVCFSGFGKLVAKV